MNVRTLFSSIFVYILRILCRPRKSRTLPSNPEKFLIIRQHNQFGDMLATIPLFKAIKRQYPDSEITLFASPENHFAVRKNKYIDRVFNFDKKQILDSDYLKEFISVIRHGYDVVLVPVTVSISSTSCILARMAKSHYTIGPGSLDGKANKLAFLFDESVELDWRKEPELNVSQFVFEILKPLGIISTDFTSHITFDDSDLKKASEFLFESGFDSNSPIVGLHVGAGKPPNRWDLKSFIEVIERLEKEFHIEFFFTGSSSDKNEIDFMKKHFGTTAGYFINRTIPELAAVISKCTLFITNDTGVMHVAGAVDVEQISLFGPTDPKNWAPEGIGKHYLRNSPDINSITVNDVYSLAREIMLNRKKQ